MKKLLLIITIIISNTLQAQIIFQDDFSTYISNQQLSGQGTWTNNSSNPGGLATCAGFNCQNSKIQDFALTYPNYGSSTKSLETTIDLDAVGRPFTVTNSGSIYISFVVNFSNAVLNPGGSTSQDFFRVMSGGNFNTSMRIGAFKVGSSFQLFIQKSGGTKVFSTDLAFNQNHLVVLKYTFNPGTTDDLVSLFVNPDVSQSEPTTTITTSSLANGETDYATGIDRLNFRSNWSTIPTGHISLVKTSTSWSSLLLNNTNFTSSNNFEVITNASKRGFLTIKSSSVIQNATFSIYNIEGKLIENKTISLNESENNIQINSITNSGIYIVELVSEKGKFSQKIVVN